MMISDEFLSVYAVGARGVRLVQSWAWDSEDLVPAVARVIGALSGPLLILNDMVEQHYRKERVLRNGINMFDRPAFLRRKLNVAFPSYPVRAAYPLKEKAQKTGKQGDADIYIFAAVAESEQLKKTVEIADRSLRSVSAFCLLPVESSGLVNALSAKLTRKNAKKPVWSVFIGQHRNGNLRQVVTKNGDLALTRMSPIMDRDDDPDAWASELYQEFKSTMGYLTRFGYEPSDGLDVVIVSNPGAGEILSKMIEEECALHVMSAGEAAETLGLSIGRQENGRYADALHVAWFARKSKFVLPMAVATIDRVSRPRKMAMAAAAVLLCGAAFLGYQALAGLSAWHTTVTAIDESQREKEKLSAEYQAEVERLNGLGFDVQLVQSSILVNDALAVQKINMLHLLKGLGRGIGKDLRVDSVTVDRYKPMGVNVLTDANAPQPLYEARLKLTYPPDANVDKGNQEVADLSKRIQAALPDAKVRVAKALKDYEYTEGLVVKAGDLEKENLQQDFLAEIVIEGQIPKAPSAADAPVDNVGGTP
jgi:hypothetical protein